MGVGESHASHSNGHPEKRISKNCSGKRGGNATYLLEIDEETWFCSFHSGERRIFNSILGQRQVKLDETRYKIPDEAVNGIQLCTHDKDDG